jgi:hypothetical protein
MWLFKKYSMKNLKKQKFLAIILLIFCCSISNIATSQSNEKILKKLKKKYAGVHYTNDNTYIVSRLGERNVWKNGIVDEKGAELIPLIYNKIFYNDSSKNYFSISSNFTFKIIDKNNNTVDDLLEINKYKYLNILEIKLSPDQKYKTNFIYVYHPLNNKVSLLRTDGKLLFDFKYSCINNFDEYSHAIAIIDDKYTVIDVKGNALLSEPIPLPKTKDYDISNMLYIYNHQNNRMPGEMFSPLATSMSPIDENTVLKYSGENQKWGVYDFKNNKDVVPAIINDAGFKGYKKIDDDFYLGKFENFNTNKVYSTTLKSYIEELNNIVEISAISKSNIYNVYFKDGKQNHYDKKNNKFLFPKEVTKVFYLCHFNNVNILSVTFQNNITGLLDEKTFNWVVEPKYKLKTDGGSGGYLINAYNLIENVEGKYGIIKVLPFEIILPFEYINKEIFTTTDSTGTTNVDNIYGTTLLDGINEDFIYTSIEKNSKAPPVELLKARNILKAYMFGGKLYVHEGKNCTNDKCAEVIEHIFTRNTYKFSFTSSKKIEIKN